MRTLEDDLWIYFGHPNEYWRNKCSRCREKVRRLKVPVLECLACWKVEIWSGSPWFLEAMGQPAHEMHQADGLQSCGLERLCSLAFKLALQGGADLIAKISKHPIQVVRTGEPSSQYPEAKTDHLLMIYASSVEERESIRLKICSVLGFASEASGNIPVRRGCWLYDPILGPWQAWESHRDLHNGQSSYLQRFST